MQRRRNMPHRSPIIFWLLLAANVCVDSVLWSLVTGHFDNYSGFASVSLHAMIQSQLSIVCIWTAVTERKNLSTLILPFAAALVAALVTATAMSATRYEPPLTFDSFFVAYLAFFGLHAALLVAALWVFRRTAFWRKRSGVVSTWQYSLGHLLFVMTIIALLALTFRQSPLVGEGGWVNIIFVVSSVLLTVASVFLWSLSWHWLLRLAAVVGISLSLAGLSVFGFSFNEGSLGPILMIIFGAHYLIQGIVLSIWLGVGELLPIAGPDSADSEPPMRPQQ
jgi:hypothetical protein